MREVIFYPSAEKFIRKIKEKPLKLKIKDAIDKICENPYVGTAKKGDLAGIWCYDVYYNKTNYEIAYKFEVYGDDIIIVIMVGTRENFYDELKKYII
jgi:mRNA-degrading endonuclease RelE of RelBE toxin-antitoxin system